VTTALLGIDVGGTGSRVALVGADGERHVLRGEGAGVTAGGSSVPATVLGLVEASRRKWPVELAAVRGVGVGATGLGTLVADVPAFTRDVAAAVAGRAADASAARGADDERSVPGVAVAIDAVTAHLGALGGEAGAVVALGTGAIAIGGDGRGAWRRVDGWGHLLGDRGGGAWIGLRGLDAAVRAHDGVDAAGSVLLDRARRRFGEPPTWPQQLYTRDDRAGVLAGFAEDVAAAAADGDTAARDILVSAGVEAARSALAALGADLQPVVAGTGGVFAVPLVADSFADAVRSARPEATIRPASGGPLDGALVLAEQAARGEVREAPGFTWTAR
jgi:N-acetylglucosamine kinase-like BadF-type ATPase